MSGTKDGSLFSSQSNAGRRNNRLGVTALTLWCLAFLCSLVDALLAFNRIRVLVFTGGLVMMDIAAAVVFSFGWIQSRQPPAALTAEDLGTFATHIWNDGHDAGYDKGYAAGAEGDGDRTPNLRLVIPEPAGHYAHERVNNM